MRPILTIFCLLAWTQFIAQDEIQDPFIADFLTKWEGAKEYTMAIADAMPAENYTYKPTDAQRAFHEQITHIIGNMIWLSTSYLGGEGLASADTENPPTGKEELMTLLEESFDYAQETIRGFDYSRIDEEVDFFAGPMSHRKIFFLMMDHLTHHRGQLVVYLRLNDIEPPRYRGW